MPSRLKMRHALIVGVVGLLLTFQNCAQPPSETATVDQGSYDDNLPHAIDAKIDTISHMSCSGITDAVERRAYYSFRVGAYNNTTGGVSLKQDFINATQFYSVEERARALAGSAKNGNSRLNVSIRQTGNLQAPWVSEEFRVGEEIEGLLPPFDMAAIAGPLGAAIDRRNLNYFPGSHTQRLMEGSLRFYKFENVMKNTRSTLDARSALLVVGFSDGSEEANTKLRGPVAGSASSVYGVGHFLRFSLPVGYQTGERRVISPTSGVEEVDLLTNMARPSSWDCSTNYQFMVIRPEDKAAGRVVCDATVDRADPAQPAQLAALQAIRRVLRVEDWFVDVARKCIIPKRTGDYCYGPLNGRQVQYGTANCTENGSFMCPHFVSVCIKR